jgi:hypothetical protein
MAITMGTVRLPLLRPVILPRNLSPQHKMFRQQQQYTLQRLQDLHQANRHRPHADKRVNAGPSLGPSLQAPRRCSIHDPCSVCHEPGSGLERSSENISKLLNLSWAKPGRDMHREQFRSCIVGKVPRIAHSGAETIQEEVGTTSRQYLMVIMTSEADINSQL